MATLRQSSLYFAMVGYKLKGLRPCRRSSLAARLIVYAVQGMCEMVYAVTHITLCLPVYEWAGCSQSMIRSKHAHEAGINAFSNGIFQQEASEQIITFVRCRISGTPGGWFCASATSSSETGTRISESISDAVCICIWFFERVSCIAPWYFY